jgi:hypothetical protein
MKDKKYKQHPLQNQQPFSAPTSNQARMEENSPAKEGQIDKEAVLKEYFYITGHTYQESIEAGFLIDVSDMAKSIGFDLSVALTKTVWESCIVWEPTDYKDITQVDSYRILDLLGFAIIAWRKYKRGLVVPPPFEVDRLHAVGEKPEKVTLSMFRHIEQFYSKQIIIRIGNK